MTFHISNRSRVSAAALALALLPGGAMAAQVFTQDVIVQGSLCVGIDCTTSESFGFDTIRLKENNLRIKAQDTSNSSSFPTVDWQITFNDSSNGGQNKFSIDDIDNARTPFTIEAGTRSNQLYVDSSNRVGFGTSTPAVDLHVQQGNTPTLRLEQDGSSGFTAQTWDMAGNETNFFVRDVTNGSQLPFRIKPNSPGDSIMIAPEGVGIGTQSPTSILHVQDSDTLVKIEDTSDNGPETLLELENNGVPMILFENEKSAKAWTMSAGSTLRFTPKAIASGDPSSVLLNESVFALEETGDLVIAGTLTQSSDKDRKMAIEPVDPAAILDKVAALPVAEWTYIHDAETGTRHVGPMAQDFHAAFGLGASETGISSLDGTGVALAAIQALHAQNQELRADLDMALSAIETLTAK